MDLNLWYNLWAAVPYGSNRIGIPCFAGEHAMSSPFPGMDPYLEERSLWPDMHLRLINNIAEALQPQVRPKYLARINERIELTGLGQGYIPDVMVVEPPREPTVVQTQVGALIADEPRTASFLDEERHIPYLEIIYRETGDVVTLIEVLSPANKVGDGRTKFIQKQRDLLDSQTNLVEIDLLSGPTATLAHAITITSPSDWRYVITISRPQRRDRLEFYAIALDAQLPRCRIPLRPADPDVVLDLPTVFSRCYDAGGYDLLLDYRQPPPVTLSQSELEWLHLHLAEQGLR